MFDVASRRHSFEIVRQVVDIAAQSEVMWSEYDLEDELIAEQAAEWDELGYDGILRRELARQGLENLSRERDEFAAFLAGSVPAFADELADPLPASVAHDDVEEAVPLLERHLATTIRRQGPPAVPSLLSAGRAAVAA